MNCVTLLSKLKKIGINIQVEKGNLKINAPKGMLTPNLIEELKLQKDAIINFFHNTQSQNDYKSINPIEKREYYPLSPPQKRLYVLQQLNIDSTAYNMPYFLSLSGNIPVKKIEEILLILIYRHESLRSSFFMVNEEPVQRVHDKIEFQIEELGNEEKNHKSSGKLLKEKYNNSFEQKLFNSLINFTNPFYLSKAPLIRVAMLEFDTNQRYLLLDMHHIITDAASQQILEREFIKLLQKNGLEPLRIQYKDFSQWQIQQNSEEFMKSQKAYWMNLFSGEVPVLNLPIDYPRPSMKSFEGNTVHFILKKDETQFLNEMAIQTNATLFIILLTIYTILLSKLSNQEDIIVGTPIGTRLHAELETVMGMFINTLALRNYPSSTMKFFDLLMEVKNTTLKAYENQQYQFEDLVDKVLVQRDTSRNPIFDVMLNLLKEADSHEGNFNIQEQEEYIHHAGTSKFDLSLTVVEKGEILHCTFIYSTKLFKVNTINKIIKYFKKIVSTFIKNIHENISNIEIISSEEKKEILKDFNETNAEFPNGKTIHQLLEDQVKITPDNISLVSLEEEFNRFGDIRKTSQPKPDKIWIQYLTYLELHKKINQLASKLIRKGIKRNSIIAIMLEPYFHMIIGIFAVLKTGSCYLPLNPQNPKERILYILKDSEARLLLTQTNLIETQSVGVDSLYIDDQNIFDEAYENLPNNTCNPNDPVYMIYTSGTTGKPKGVMVKHENLVNYITWFSRVTHLKGQDRSVLNSSYAFDLGYTSLYPSILRGGQLHLLTEDIYMDPEKYWNYIGLNKITYLKVTPSFFKMILINHEFLKKNCQLLRLVVMGGESINIQDVERMHEICPHIKIMNHYGPTEVTIGSIYKFIDFDYIDQYKIKPTIGKPIANTKAFILDKHFKLLPVGIAGELCLSGAGVAKGYYKQNKLTSERFISNVFMEEGEVVKPYDRCYRTGDLARWTPDGNIEFLGRIDHQVKIRGYRIELSEIENLLLLHEKINEVVVVAHNDKDIKYLCAYLVSDENINTDEIRNFLSEKAPDYMVPGYFIQLDEIPLTPNGKIDRKKLPKVESMDWSDRADYLAPRNWKEQIMAEIWQKVLGINRVGINDNFFEIGGDSIRTLQIISRLKKNGYKLEMRDIFRNPKISQLAPYIKKIDRIAEQSSVKGMIPLSPIQKWFFDRDVANKHLFCQTCILHWPAGLDKKAVDTIFKKIQIHHDALRINFMQKKGNVIQTNHPLDYPLSLEVYDFRKQKGVKELIENRVQHVQTSIDLDKGPLMKLTLFHTDEGDFLLIVIHCLIIDKHSWMILFEDIETLLQQYIRGEHLVLPLKTDSFKYWAEMLFQYANNDSLLKEKEFWLQLETKNIPLVKEDFQEKDNCNRDQKTITIAIDQEKTLLMLNKANEAFGTEINELLLSALGGGLKETFGNKQLLIAIIDHTRDHELLENININRTVGWFTTLFPFLLDFSYHNDWSRQIIEIKESLRRIPNKGIGYGLLKYLSSKKYLEESSFKWEPQIGFNYLQQNTYDIKDKSFVINKDSAKSEIILNQQGGFEIEVSGFIKNQELVISISYNPMKFKMDTMDLFVDNFRKTINHVVSYCISKKNRELTPSDFSYPGLFVETLQKLQRKYSYQIEDINTLSPMQLGKMFYTLYDRSSSGGSVHTKFNVSGKINLALFERSINEVFKRYGILRTAFIYDELEVPVQIILKERQINLIYEDLRENSQNTDIGTFINEFEEKEKKRSFDLEKDVLMRISILQIEESEYILFWSYHHILMDGWCLGILFNEFLKIYNGFLAKKPYQLPSIQPYKNFLKWLFKQNESAPELFWTKYLEGFEKKTSVPQMHELKANNDDFNFEDIPFNLSAEKTRALNGLSRKFQVTLNTIIQCIWGIILSNYNQQEEVVFGAVVSGRPSDLPGVELMVGLFINTIPVRISCKPTKAFKELAQQVQADAVECEPFHYYSLSRIQALSMLKQNLLDHIIVFENYPLAEQLEGIAEAIPEIPFNITDVGGFTKPDYNLHLVIRPGDTLRYEFRINAKVYDRNFIIELAQQIEELLDAILDNNDITLDKLRISDKRPKAKTHEKGDYLDDFGF